MNHAQLESALRILHIHGFVNLISSTSDDKVGSQDDIEAASRAASGVSVGRSMPKISHSSSPSCAMNSGLTTGDSNLIP